MSEKSGNGELSDDEIERIKAKNRKERPPTVFDLAARRAMEEAQLDQLAAARVAQAIGATAIRTPLMDQHIRDKLEAERRHLEQRQARAERFDGLYGMGYLDMLNGQIHGRPDHGVTPGLPSLYEGLMNSQAEFNTHGILDNDGNQVEGWVLGSIIEPHAPSGNYNRNNEGVTPDRHGLVLTLDGAVHEFYSGRGPGVPGFMVVENTFVNGAPHRNITQRDGFEGIHGPDLHDIHEIAPYDVESAAPPSFVSGDDAVKAWISALEKGMADLALHVGPPPSDALSTMDPEPSPGPAVSSGGGAPGAA
jgi:hypothetical protein